MRHLILAAAALLAGCGGMGLESYAIDTGADGVWLEISPANSIDFAYVEEGSAAGEEASLMAQGDGKVAIIDVYLDPSTDSAFSLGSDLPLPLRLPAGEEFPVNISFAPTTLGEYSGALVVEIDRGGEIATETRSIRGTGCAPQGPEACP